MRTMGTTRGKLTGKDFISTADWSRDELGVVLDVANELKAALAFIMESRDKNTVFWIDYRGEARRGRGGQAFIVLQATPIDVSQILKQTLFEKVDTAVLASATLYSRVLFGGALAYWLFNTLGSVIRGTGNMALPASVMVGSGCLYLALSPALILGWGPLPRLGIAGAAAASVTSFSLGSLALLGFLLSGRSLVRPTRRGLRLRWALFWEIVRVGAPGSLNTILTNLTVVLLTGLVGPFGATALAGYGLGARLEYLQIPIVFGLGSGLVTMVGTSMGAGHRARAQRVLRWKGQVHTLKDQLEGAREPGSTLGGADAGVGGADVGVKERGEPAESL